MDKNTERKTVLILEDEDNIRAALARAFRRCSDYDFEVETVESPAACVEQNLDERRFDVYLVDLEMEHGVRPFFGQRFIAVRALEERGSIIVVYSCHSDVENVAQAAQNGAHAFLVKGTLEDRDVVDRVVALINAMRDSDEEERKRAAITKQKQQEWQSQYAGKAIIVVGEDVVVSARSRLAAIVEYEKLRREHVDWPENPMVLRLPKLDDAFEY